MLKTNLKKRKKRFCTPCLILVYQQGNKAFFDTVLTDVGYHYPISKVNTLGNFVWQYWTYFTDYEEMIEKLDYTYWMIRI